MERSKAEGKRRSKEDDDDQDDDCGAGGDLQPRETDSKMTKSGRRGSSSSGNEAAAALVTRCQVENCGADLSDAKKYHRRHKVCEFHAKAPFVRGAALPQRFCQQCSRFHDLSEFDDSKRSCRRRLAGHNERRRKSSAE